MNIKKGDTIVVTRGKNRGKTGKVLLAYPKEERIIIEGVNIQKKHVRPRRQGEKGQIVEIPGPVQISNVKVICAKCSKATRVGHQIEGGSKVRVCKKCNEQI
ncbi:MAG: 50S ribosomal protein L24 [Candidatus Spechtbacterales bacterium]